MEKKIVCITGVSKEKGLGFATAKEFLKLDYQVIITARKQSQLDKMLLRLKKEEKQVEGLIIDLLDEESIKRAANIIKKKYGKLDILINNAAMLWDASMQSVLEMESEQIKKEMNTNFIGTWLVMKYFHPLLALSKQGRIVNVSSGAGSYYDPEFGILHNFDSQNNWPISLYGITKLALNALTLKAAKEFQKDNILVNAICPGVMATNSDLGRNPQISAREGILFAATLENQTGGFYRDDKILPW